MSKCASAGIWLRGWQKLSQLLLKRGQAGRACFSIIHVELGFSPSSDSIKTLLRLFTLALHLQELVAVLCKPPILEVTSLSKWALQSDHFQPH